MYPLSSIGKVNASQHRSRMDRIASGSNSIARHRVEPRKRQTSAANVKHQSAGRPPRWRADPRATTELYQRSKPPNNQKLGFAAMLLLGASFLSLILWNGWMHASRPRPADLLAYRLQPWWEVRDVENRRVKADNLLQRNESGISHRRIGSPDELPT